MAIPRNKWNIGEKNKTLNEANRERAVLIGAILPPNSEEKITEYLDELDFLAQTAGAAVVKRFVQKMQKPDSKTFIGSGKVEEIGKYIESHEIDLAIFDEDLTGKQTNILEEAWKVKIVDRTSLILGHLCRSCTDCTGTHPGGAGSNAIFTSTSSGFVDTP